MQDKLMSQKEVAEAIGVHPNTVKNWRDAKLLSFFRAPGSRRPFYFKEEVEGFIKDNTTGRAILGKPSKVVKRSATSKSSAVKEDWRIE